MQSQREKELRGALEQECSNAQEFIQERLSRSNRPMSPTELAAEYGCTRGHMASEMSQLKQNGAVKRVGTGKYELAETPEETESDGEIVRGNTNETAQSDAEEPRTNEAGNGDSDGGDDAGDDVEDPDAEDDQEGEEDLDDRDDAGDQEASETEDGQDSDGFGTAEKGGVALAAVPFFFEDDGTMNWEAVGIALVIVVIWYLLSKKDLSLSVDQGQSQGQQQEQEQEDQTGGGIPLMEG